MRRILTLVAVLALVALFAMPAQAQEKSVRIGVQAGMTSSSLSGDDVPDDASSKTGFFAGGYFNYMFAKNWGVSVEGNWLAGVGAKDSEGEIKLSYLEFPLGLNFVFPLGESEKTWLGLQSGITAMINLSCKEGPTENVNIDCKDETESVAWAVPFGASLGFKMSDAAVVWLGARYQLGLNDVFSDDTAAKLNIWEFLVGVGFPTG
jgi:hypothetical protein